MNIFKKGFRNSMNLEKLLAEQYGQSKLSFFVFMLLRLIVVAVLIISIIRGRYENITMCVLTLVLFTLPPIIERTINADFPTLFEVFVLLFIFSAQMLGEIGAFYVKIPVWDTILHTTSGFVIAAFGFSLVDLFHKDSNLKFKLSPFYMALNSFGFAMTIGVIWEFFECGMDVFFGRDMQKDTVIKSFQSVMLDPTNSNIPIKVEDIQTVLINGTALPFNGYLDIGLHDTMKDLAVAALGAALFCIFAYTYIKTGGKNKIASLFIPVRRNWKQNPPDIEADLAERIANFESELEERRKAFEAELEERRRKFDKELEDDKSSDDDK